jgi:hypothetical protein
MQLIHDTISSARLGKPKTFRNLTVFPVFGSGIAPDYFTLDEALASKLAKVTEVSEGGSVPDLKFVNDSDSAVFLMEGEELIGAKQNRTLNLSILIPAKRAVSIPVSCVERGRWRHTSREFSSAPRAQYAEGRARKMVQVSASLQSTGTRYSNQGAVWRDIDEKSRRLSTTSHTSAMADIFEQHSAGLEEYVRSFPPEEGQVGAVFAIGDTVSGFELFDSSDTLRKLWPKLMRSYGLDALDRAGSAGEKGENPPPDAGKIDVKAFLQRVSGGEAKQYLAIGEGEDIRLSNVGLTGAALAARGRVIHLSAFAARGVKINL